MQEQKITFLVVLELEVPTDMGELVL